LVKGPIPRRPMFMMRKSICRIAGFIIRLL
jgi:hypothetical protein